MPLMSREKEPTKRTWGEREWRRSIEDRRGQVEGFTWSVPGLAVAAQAFILTITLRPEITQTARLLAALAGAAAAIATLHFYAKQVYLFDLYEGAIEADRQKLRLPGLQLDELRAMPIPENTSYRTRRWEANFLRRHLVVDRKAANVWMWTLAGFVVLDLLLAAYAIVALAGADPGWLGSGPK